VRASISAPSIEESTSRARLSATLGEAPFSRSASSSSAIQLSNTSRAASLNGSEPAAVAEWGGFLSDLVAVPYARHMLVALPEGVEPARVASASDNIADAWRTVAPALEREPGASVLVLGGAGAGSIGVYAAGIARALGSEWVLYVDPDESRRAAAEAIGAQTMAEAPRRLGPFPITVDACGDPAMLALALRSTAPDGVCTSAAIYFGEQPELPLLELDLTASGRLRPERVTSAVVPWEQASEALVEDGWTKLVFER
jgi:threonine dehydrogenase-like Zn-dependent dehydrogenase